MKSHSAALAVVVLAGLLALGCEEDESAYNRGEPDRGAAVPISGEATLSLDNHTRYDVAVYFDGSYIGEVQSEAGVAFSVPTGSHAVMVDAQIDLSEDDQATCAFEAGMSTRVVIESKGGSYDRVSYETLSLHLTAYAPGAPSA